MAHNSISPAQALSFADGRPVTPIASVAFKVAVLIAKWENNRRTRLHLKTLDDHLLDDIGVTRDMASSEARRPFWQD